MPTGRPPKPPGQSVTRHKRKYEWEEAPTKLGWQHGEIPDPPEGLMPESLEAWNLWFTAWWAAKWKLEDVPGLRLVIRRFDDVVRNKADLAKVLPEMHCYGLTPKGRTDLRWAEPKPEDIKPEQRGEVRRLRVADTA